MPVEATAYHFFPVVEAMVEWGTEAAVAAIGDPTAMGEVLFSPPVVRGPPGKVETVTLAALDAMAAGDALPDGTMFDVSNAGFLAVPLTAGTYRRFYAIHVGPTPPDDPFAIWLDTSL